MYQEWNLENNDIKIKIINLGFGGEELYINEKLVDKTKTFFGTTRLIAQHEDKLIKVNLGTYKGGMKIEIIINEIKIFEKTIGMLNTALLTSIISTIAISVAAFLIITTIVSMMY